MINVKNASFSVTAEVIVSDVGASGVVLAQGGVAGGWSPYSRTASRKYRDNLVGL